MKKIIYCLFGLITIFSFVTNVDAGSISLIGSGSVTVGNRVVVTVKSNNIFAKYSLTSSDSSVLSGGISNATIDTGETTTYTFNARNVGTSTIRLGLIDCAAYDDVGCSGQSLTVRVNPARQLSTDNTLSGLGIDGATLEPEFNKDTLEYTAMLEAGTTKINVTGSASDKYANVSGLGEREVEEGDNNIEVVVTAENGSTKTYIIKATVKEFNPVKIEIGKSEYTVVRNKKNLVLPENYIEKTVKINNEEVPACYSEITKYTLVSLKNSNGKQDWYVKDKDNYTLYKEYKFGSTILYPMELDEIPESYSKSSIEYNKQKINAYQINSDSDYALIYALNVETGEKHIYMYDSKEGTVQIYNDEQVLILKKQSDLYLKTLIGVSIGLVLSIGIMIFISRKKIKK